MIPKIFQNTDQVIRFTVVDDDGDAVPTTTMATLTIQAIRDDGFELQEFSFTLGNITIVDAVNGVVEVILSRENMVTDKNRFVSFRVNVGVANIDFFNGIKNTVVEIKNVFELCK
jgi:hypothetical protein